VAGAKKKKNLTRGKEKKEFRIIGLVGTGTPSILSGRDEKGNQRKEKTAHKKKKRRHPGQGGGEPGFWHTGKFEGKGGLFL